MKNKLIISFILILIIKQQFCLNNLRNFAKNFAKNIKYLCTREFKAEEQSLKNITTPFIRNGNKFKESEALRYRIYVQLWPYINIAKNYKLGEMLENNIDRIIPNKQRQNEFYEFQRFKKNVFNLTFYTCAGIFLSYKYLFKKTKEEKILDMWKE
jgi:hypothetical protein